MKRGYGKALATLHESIVRAGMTHIPYIWITHDYACATCGSPRCVHASSWHHELGAWEVQWELVRCSDCLRYTVWKMIHPLWQLPLF